MKKIFIALFFILTFLAGFAGGIKITQISINAALESELKESRARRYRRMERDFVYYQPYGKRSGYYGR